MSDVIGLIIPFFGLILLGVIAARTAKLPDDALGWINVFIIYFALPALFFQLLSKTPVDQLTEWSYISGTVLATFLVFSIMFVGSLLLQKGLAESTIKGLAAAYGNIGYMGPGIAILAFGQGAAVPVALIFCFENLMHFTIAPLMMALAGKSDESPFILAGQIVKKIVLHPFIVATAFGVTAAVLRLEIPGPLDRLLVTLSQAAAPCALFAMGVTLVSRPLKRLPSTIVQISILKLAVHPVLCYLILSWIGDFSPVWAFTAVLLAALPTATNVFVIGQQYGVWVERASASILITTVLSVVTVTVILYAIKNGTLPPDLFPNR
ncbi:MAG: AEC family transporter [Rhizobiaceae bacterium]